MNKLLFNKSSSSSRVRKFSLITYLNEPQICTVLAKHATQIRAYAYAYHDKDCYDEDDEKNNPKHKSGTLKIPHYHIALSTYNGCTLSAVKRWFKGFVDTNGEINTLGLIPTDIYWAFDYLTHSDKDSVLKGKYQYDNSIIVSNDLNFFQADSRSDFDNILLSSEMLLEGYSVRELGQRFGRDFILNYSKIKKYLCDVQLQEHNSFDNDHLIKYEINLLNKNDIYL